MLSTRMNPSCTLTKLVHQSQADACSLVCATTGVRHRVESLEQSWYFFGRYPNASISQSKLGDVSDLFHAYRNFSSNVNLKALEIRFKNDLFPHVPIY